MLLQDAAEWLGDQLQTVAGVSVLYVRRSEILPVVGWLTMQDYILESESGMPQTVMVYDWSFLRADLELEDGELTPRPGDRIVHADLTYEVMPLGETRPCHALLDPSLTLITVHTKRL